MISNNLRASVIKNDLKMRSIIAQEILRCAAESVFSPYSRKMKPKISPMEGKKSKSIHLAKGQSLGKRGAFIWCSFYIIHPRFKLPFNSVLIFWRCFIWHPMMHVKPSVVSFAFSYASLTRSSADGAGRGEKESENKSISALRFISFGSNRGRLRGWLS